jgi:hypothetical protein
MNVCIKEDYNVTENFGKHQIQQIVIDLSTNVCSPFCNDVSADTAGTGMDADTTLK